MPVFGFIDIGDCLAGLKNLRPIKGSCLRENETTHRSPYHPDGGFT
jgi:hypothetical protein